MMQKNTDSAWISALFGLLVIPACTSVFINYVMPLASVANAQISPDGSVPTTVTSSDGRNFTITDGTRSGVNLFHSFREFSIPTNGEAFFNNPADIQNIFSRVTGNSTSTIDGLIRTNGTANLFLINPNGIIFGENARLNLGGSFFATTADSIIFKNGDSFSAINSNSPPLLTISVPVGLQYGDNSGSIAVQGAQLTVDPGNAIALFGGNVSVNGGTLRSPSGRIEIGGILNTGTINLQGEKFLAQFPETATRSLIQITNAATLNVMGSGGGTIAINAGNLEILGNSQLLAGILSELGTPESVAGEIEINSQGNITIAGESAIANTLEESTTGQGGPIRIFANSVNLRNLAEIRIATAGSGNSGQIDMTIGDSILIDNAAIISEVELDAPGNGGTINFTANSLTIRNNGEISTSKFGRGNAGDVNVNIQNNLLLETGSISSSILAGSSGNGGDININTGSLIARDGGFLDASNIFGRGNAGNITINARDRVIFAGANGTIPSGAFSNAESLGDGGDINIIANSVLISNGAQVDTVLAGVGNGGDIYITTGALSILDGGGLNADVFGEGNAGAITINASNQVLLDGTTSSALTGIFNTVGSEAQGQGGDVNIIAGSLILRNGANIQTVTRGIGNAGNVNINTDEIVAIDGTRINGLPSVINSSVAETAEGEGGKIAIFSGSLFVTNGAQLVAETEGMGSSGNVQISVSDRILFDRQNSESPTGIFSTVGENAIGNGGNIEITGATIAVTNGSVLSTSTFGEGDAGNIRILARDRVLFDGLTANEFITSPDFEINFLEDSPAEIEATQNAIELNRFPSAAFTNVDIDAQGNGGDIEIQTAGSVNIRNGARLIAGTEGSGNAGNIRIIAGDRVEFDSIDINTPSAAFTTVELFGVGEGGNIEITTDHFSLNNGAFLSANSQGGGAAGNIIIQAISTRLNNQAALSAETAGGEGNIVVRSQDLILRRNSNITTNAVGTATGGNITFIADAIAALENSDISANAEESQGGQINITTNGIFGTAFRRIPSDLTSDITATSEAGPQLDGTVNIQTPDIDPTAGLVELPANFVDLSNLIARSCSMGELNRNQFFITGRGGLPPSPLDTFSQEALVVPPIQPNTTGHNSSTHHQSQRSASASSATHPNLQEAQGWIIDTNGKIILTAEPPRMSQTQPAITPTNCTNLQ